MAKCGLQIRGVKIVHNLLTLCLSTRKSCLMILGNLKCMYSSPNDRKDDKTQAYKQMLV